MKLVYDTLSGWLRGGPIWMWVLLVPLVLLALALLGHVVLGPLFRVGRVWESGLATASRAVARMLKPVPITHIGVALEHTEGDAEVISAALAMAKAHGARLTLVHVVVTPGTQMLGGESQSRHGQEDAAYLEELAREIEERDLPVETMLRFGDPADEIVKSVDETGFDMLVLGSHGHSGVGDIVFGQTVARVRHLVKIPVLTVHTRGTEQAQRNG